LTVDCANGVGAHALLSLQKYIPADQFPLRVLRTSITTPGALNNNCGADYVKTNQRLPLNLEKDGIQSGDRICSFDGDADRIIYYYLRGNIHHKESFRLLDGDKIASLATDFISELVKKAGVDLQVGCVQTAYANGSSTKYLKQVSVMLKRLIIKVLFIPTFSHSVSQSPALPPVSSTFIMRRKSMTLASTLKQMVMAPFSFPSLLNNRFEKLHLVRLLPKMP
jgi:hypothetical protein